MTPKRWHPIAWTVGALLCCSLIILGHEQRELHLTVAEQMAWECSTMSRLIPEPGRPAEPGAPIVIFRFVEAPEEHDWQGDPDGSFCRSLQQHGKPEVTLISDVWGNRWQGWLGFREITIDNRPFPTYPLLGGFGGGPLQNPEPYAVAFDTVYPRPLEKKMRGKGQ